MLFKACYDKGCISVVTPWLHQPVSALDMRTYYWLLVRAPVMKTVKNASKL